jgi:NhaP-type Na+/H+ or K+/H+ antiporter
LGVLLSTAVIGALTWCIFPLLDADLPIAVCFVFGAVVSPTDPIRGG